MEITARLHSSTLFSDQSHLLFYGCSSSSHCKPFKSHFHTELSSSLPLPLASRRAAALPALHSASQPSPSTMTASNTCSELDLLKELAILKAQVKLKKKQLKTIAKDKKTALKQKKAKAKGGSSSSSSSSSSEGSDGERMSLNMRLLKKDLSQNRQEKGVTVRGESHGLDHTDIQQGSRNEGIMQCASSRSEPCRPSFSIDRADSQSTRPYDQDGAISGMSPGALGAGRAHAISGSIEVCVGGKCKKAGSQQLLSSFKAQIPASASVEATPCKCMGRCGTTINVKVRKENTNPQHHSHVRVDDAGLILGHHFGLGPPLSCLPYFSSLSPTTHSVSF